MRHKFYWLLSTFTLEILYIETLNLKIYYLILRDILNLQILGCLKYAYLKIKLLIVSAALLSTLRHKLSKERVTLKQLIGSVLYNIFYLGFFAI